MKCLNFIVELQKLIEAKTSTFDSKSLLNELEDLNVPAGKIRNLKEVFEDESAQKLVREEEIDGVLTKRVSSKVFK